MPHVIVKLWPGKSERQKIRLTEEIVEDVMNVLSYGEEAVSLAIEEVKPEDWAEKVYKSDVVNNSAKLYKKPGYTMLVHRSSTACFKNHSLRASDRFRYLEIRPQRNPGIKVAKYTQ